MTNEAPRRGRPPKTDPESIQWELTADYIKPSRMRRWYRYQAVRLHPSFIKKSSELLQTKGPSNKEVAQFIGFDHHEFSRFIKPRPNTNPMLPEGPWKLFVSLLPLKCREWEWLLDGTCFIDDDDDPDGIRIVPQWAITSTMLRVFREVSIATALVNVRRAIQGGRYFHDGIKRLLAGTAGEGMVPVLSCSRETMRIDYLGEVSQVAHSHTASVDEVKKVFGIMNRNDISIHELWERFAYSTRQRAVDYFTKSTMTGPPSRRLRRPLA